MHQKMETQLTQVSNINSDQRQHIHWRTIELAYKKLSVTSRLPIFNFLHNKSISAMTIAKFNADTNPHCLRCEMHVEKFLHLFQCPSETTRSVHKSAKEK